MKVVDLATAKPPNTDVNLESLAEEFSLAPILIQTVIEVESNNLYFDKKNRLTLLYEPHVAYRLCTDEGTRGKLMEANLAYPRWGTAPYPTSSDQRFKQVQGCADIAGIEIALGAASWGAPQILGLNYGLAGFESAEGMVGSFASGGATAQVRGMLTFIKLNPEMYRALRGKQWAVFARAYNGPKYEVNKYHIKLANAYDELMSKIALSEKPNPVVILELSLGSKGEEVMVVQKYLNKILKTKIVADGIFGKATLLAVISFQTKNGLTPDGIVGQKTLDKLGLVFSA